ncbi:Peptidase family M23 [Marivirga sericea]|uniref:Peptidase family M23 n=1 Tax=Marivirga sericea TaxID=1028 RepID=A0A1X7KND4_9BACT|nr:M23 family metallopeptidase [Marivirga sericea]SMG42703.1 Peptidase family M23 [Marivirga sericea]
MTEDIIPTSLKIFTTILFLSFSILDPSYCFAQEKKIKINYSYSDRELDQDFKYRDKWYISTAIIRSDPNIIKSTTIKADSTIFQFGTPFNEIDFYNEPRFTEEIIKSGEYFFEPITLVNQIGLYDYLLERKYFLGVKSLGFGPDGQVIYYLASLDYKNILNIDFAFGILSFDSTKTLITEPNKKPSWTKYSTLDSEFANEIFINSDDYTTFEESINEIEYKAILSKIKEIFLKPHYINSERINVISTINKRVNDSGFGIFTLSPGRIIFPQTSIFRYVYGLNYRTTTLNSYVEQSEIKSVHETTFLKNYEIRNPFNEIIKLQKDYPTYSIGVKKNKNSIYMSLLSNEGFKVYGYKGLIKEGKINGDAILYLNYKPSISFDNKKDLLIESNAWIAGMFDNNKINGAFELKIGHDTYKGISINGVKHGKHIISRNNQVKYIAYYENGILKDSVKNYIYDEILPLREFDVSPSKVEIISLNENFRPNTLFDNYNKIRGVRNKPKGTIEYIINVGGEHQYSISGSDIFFIDKAKNEIICYYPDSPIKKIKSGYKKFNNEYHFYGDTYLYDTYGVAKVINRDISNLCAWDDIEYYIFHDGKKGEIIKVKDNPYCTSFTVKYPVEHTSYKFPKDIFRVDKLYNRFSEDIGKVFEKIEEEICNLSGADNCTFNFYVGGRFEEGSGWSYVDKQGNEIIRPNYEYENYYLTASDINEYFNYEFKLNDINFFLSLIEEKDKHDQELNENKHDNSIVNNIDKSSIFNVNFGTTNKYIGGFANFGSPTLSGIVRNDYDGHGMFLSDRLDKKHSGTDFLATPGEPIFSTMTGKVIDIGIVKNGYDNQKIISIQNEFGYISRHFYVFPEVKQGDFVYYGQKIGTMTNMVKELYPHLRYMQNHIHIEYISPDCKIISPNGLINIKLQKPRNPAICNISD